MPSALLNPEPVLTPDEYAAIDTFCQGHRGEGGLSALAGFLERTFSLPLVLDQAIVEGFITDSSNLPGKAAALCRPSTERECAVVLRACSAAGIPVTVSGGKSNLTGSATPEAGVVLSTVKMLSPGVSLDRSGMLVRSPVGVIVEDLRKEVLRLSGGELEFPVDPTSRTDATVGGTLACNASGFTPGERGAIRHWVESLDILLVDGDRLTACRGEYVSENGAFALQKNGGQVTVPVPRYHRPKVKNAGGPFSSPGGVLDLVDLVVGSEGIFGVVTGCSLRVQERPAEYLDLFFSLPDERSALAFRDAMAGEFGQDLGSFSAFEYFGVNCRRFMTHEARFFHADHQVGVYIQQPLATGTLEDAAGEWLERLAAADCGVDEDAVMLLDNERDRALFLEARHSMPANAVEAVKHHGTFTIMTDTVVPPDAFPGFLAFTHQRIASAGIDYLSFGHLGDCHLHFTLLPTRQQTDDGVAVYDEIVAKSAELGGVYSGEHGTGKRKRKDFLRCYGPEAVAQVHSTKAGFDPELVLNRGNVLQVA